MEIDAGNEPVERYKKDYLPKLILFRAYVLHKTQNEIADTLGCTRANISKFEQGKTLSGRILIYYIIHGLAEFLVNFDKMPPYMWIGGTK